MEAPAALAARVELAAPVALVEVVTSFLNLSRASPATVAMAAPVGLQVLAATAAMVPMAI
jgi:hypothetical protein